MIPDPTSLTFHAIALLAFLAVLQASYQLATSVLTLLSGHSLMHSRATRRLVLLNSAFVTGTIISTFTLLSLLSMILVLWVEPALYFWLWVVVMVWASAAALTTMLLYYRHGKGTRLWLPRNFAAYLTKRAKKTKNSFEALALGIISTLAELPFTGVIFVMSGLVLASVLPLDTHPAIIAVYCLVSSLPLIIVTLFIAGGHKLSSIQRWRESNKGFLQYAAGIGLLAATLYAIVYFVTFSEAV